MVSKKITISNKTGLHLRPAGILSKIAGGCKSSVTLIKGDKKVNAKSIMGMMTLKFGDGKEVYISADGNDEEHAVNEMEKYLTSAVV